MPDDWAERICSDMDGNPTWVDLALYVFVAALLMLCVISALFGGAA